MRSIDNIVIEKIIDIITNIDLKNAKDIAKEKDKKALFDYVVEEFFNEEEYKYLLSIIEFRKEDIIEILYQFLAAIINKDNSTYEDSIMKTKKLLMQASEYNFTWPNSNSCFKKVEEEFLELKNAIKSKSSSNIKEEIGDLLFTLQCYADKKNYDIINILDTANKKFEKRFKKLKELAKLENIELNKASIETKERLWKKAKKKANLP